MSSSLSASGTPNTSAIIDKKVERGEIDSTSSSSSSSASSEPAPIIKPDVPGFLKQFLISDVLVNILIVVTLVGSLGVYLSHVAHSNCMPGLDINVSNDLEESIMNIIHEWGWSFRPEQTWGQKASFAFDKSKTLFTVFAQKPGDPTSGIQPYLYKIIEYLSQVNNLCTNTIFGGMYHLPQWLTMLVCIPVVLLTFMFLLLVNSIFHIVGIVKFFTTLFNNGEEGLGETVGHACYALFHLFVLTWIVPWITATAAFVEPMRATFQWANATGGGKTEPKSFQDFFGVFVSAMQPFILILISLSMISNANMYLGDGFTGGAVLAVLFFAYRGWYRADINALLKRNTFFKL